MSPPSTRDEGGILIIRLDDTASVNDGHAEPYRRALYEAVASREAPRVAVDLGPIEFLSSSGVALLIGLRRRVAAAGGTLALFHLHPYVSDLLRVMRVETLFRIAPDEPAVRALLRPSPTA